MLIYQYWIGDIPAYAQASQDAFRDYAQRIGADYRFDHNPTFSRNKYAAYFTALRPIFDEEFHTYERVLFVDMDVMPRADLSESIFDLPVHHLSMVEEIDQPTRREAMDPTSGGRISAANDRKWAKLVRRIWRIDVPKDAEGRPRVYNSGVVLYSQAGLRILRKQLPKPVVYQFFVRLARLPRFYKLDQNYLGAFLKHRKLGFSPLPPEWNSQVISLHNADGQDALIDERTENTKFVHVQHSGRNQMDYQEMRAVGENRYDFMKAV